MKNIADNLRGKLVDGVLAAGVLLLTELLAIMLIKPINILFSRPGMLVYTVVLLAVSMICLERCLSPRYEDWLRAWWGVLGGMMCWVVIELSHWMGGLTLTTETGIVIFLMALLFVGITWKRVAPESLRYFYVLTLAGWVGHIVLVAARFLSTQVQMGWVLTGLGVVAGISALGSLVYIFGFSKDQKQRLNAAIVIWFAAMVMIYVFRGNFV
jgi:hypothetical protein